MLPGAPIMMGGGLRFPQVVSVTPIVQTQQFLVHQPVLDAGDMLVAVVACPNIVSTFGGVTEIGRSAAPIVPNTGSRNARVQIFALLSNGGTTFFELGTTSSTSRWAVLIYRIKGATAWQAGSFNDATTGSPSNGLSQPDTPALSAGVVRPHLWIAGVCTYGAAPAGNSAGWTGRQVVQPASPTVFDPVLTNFRLAQRASAIDPGPFGADMGWAAMTVAVFKE